MAYIDTPRTDTGNATFMTNGHRLEDFSVENSFVAPQKKSEDLFAAVRQGRGLNLRTPTIRQPFGDRRNVSKIPAQAEFTPLLKSIGKNNLQRHKDKLRGGPQTPAFLHNGVQAVETPVLPNGDYSGIYVDELGSLVAGEENTPLPPVASSSAQSTPYAAMPARDVNAPLDAQGVLTLKDQENVIDKIGKENFNLKLKIHFLEEALRKASPGYHEVALKENTDLKVDKVSMQKELARAKKTLAKAEQELETYRQHLQDVQEKMKTRHANEGLKEELQRLQFTLASRDTQIKELRLKIESAETDNENIEKYQNDIDDLEAELREKERLIEDKEDAVEILQGQLEEEKERNEGDQDNRKSLQEKSEELQEAIQLKQKAEEDLEELRDEMSNKSFTTKGLTRQLEDKAEKLEGELGQIRDRHSDLEARFAEISRQLKDAQEKLEDVENDSDAQRQHLKNENELLRNDRDAAERKCQTLLERAQDLDKRLRNESEEKDLLHSRHDTLTSESHALQKDIAKANGRIEKLQFDVEQEKKCALENDKRLRNEAKVEFDRLTEETDDACRRLEDKESQYISDKDYWEAQHRDLQSQKAKAEERANGLQRTVDTLRESQGTLPGKEMKLQQALESEKKRHEDEEAVLLRQIQELKDDLAEKREDLETLRAEVAEARDDLRITERDRLDLEEKVQELQDEVDVLQNGVEEDENVNLQLNEVRENLHQVEGDRQTLQEQLALASASSRDLHRALDQTEVERDELRSRTENMQAHFDKSQKLDQEKIELLSRLRQEQNHILREKEHAEDCLNDHIRQAASEEARLVAERAELERKVAALTKDRERDAATSKARIQRLQAQVEQLEGQLQHETGHDGASPDLSILREDLSQARKKETALIQRESTLRDSLRDLKRKVAELERQAHDSKVSRLAYGSPKSSVAESVRMEELNELRQQLNDSRHQLSDFRTKSRKAEETLQRKLIDAQRQEHAALQAHSEQIEVLEEELRKCRKEKEQQEIKASEAQNNEKRLQNRFKILETSLKSAHETNAMDITMANERKDLHEMLKSAKLESEDLELQVAARDMQIKAYVRREKHLVRDLRKAREERLTHEEKTISLSSELDRLQLEYDAALNKFSRKQKSLEAERKAILGCARSTNLYQSDQDENQRIKPGGLGKVEQALNTKEKQHQLELRGLMKQMQWLKERFMRESSFRENLQYEKRYLSLEIDMYKSCNQIDLDLLAKMVPRPRLPEQKKPGLKATIIMVIATLRMQKMAAEWGKKKKVRDALVRKWEEQKRESKGKSAARR